MSTHVILALLLGTWSLLLIRLWRRHRWFAKKRDVFRCRIRLVTGWVPELAHEWRGRPGWARWVHDVLIFRSGGISGRTYFLPVHTVVGPVLTSVAGGVGRLGKRPVLARLRLDADDVVELAAPSSAHDLIAGPFLVAGVLHSRDTTDRPPPAR